MKDKLEKKITDYARFYFPRIDVEMGNYIANARCHHNSKQMLEEKKCDEIAMVILIDSGEVIAHFIPVVKGKFVENTLGYGCKKFEYYLVKKLHPKETEDMDSMLGLFKRQFLNMALDPMERFIFGILGGRI